MRKLKLKINDKDYILEMNRETIKWLEDSGFTIEDFYKKPVTFQDLVWTSLFIANHRDVNPSLALRLLEKYENSGKKAIKIIKFAIEEYQSFMSALADIDLTENDEKLEIIEN